MQDEIVSRLANTLNAQFIEAEARRAESSLHPNSMDFYFQGMAWFNKGQTPEHMAQAAGFFERALALDPKNIEALVGMASVNMTTATTYLTDDRVPRLVAAEMALTKALSLAPHHAGAHVVLGTVKILTNRVAQGVAECEQALVLDRNLAGAHAGIGLAKFFMGRGAETEAHVREAFRLSPRDTSLPVDAVCRARQVAARRPRRSDRLVSPKYRGQPQFSSLSISFLAAALVLLGAVDEARAAAQAGLVLDPGFTIRRFRAGVSSDNPIYLAWRERVYRACTWPVCPRGNVRRWVIRDSLAMSEPLPLSP